MIIDCRTIVITALLSFFSGAKLRIGKYHKYRFFFYHHAIKGFTEKMNQMKKYHQLLKPLGIDSVSTEYAVCLKDEEKREWREKMEKRG